MKANKRRIAKNMVALLVALIITSMIASLVIAGEISDVVDKLRGNRQTYAAGSDTLPGNGKIVDFYNRHQSLVDFFIMFMLFCSAVLIGLKKVGYGDTGNAMKGLAIAFGIAMALAALKAGISPSFFIPFVKNFVFLIVFFVVFLIIRATFAQESVLWPLVGALLVTWIAFNVFNLVLEPADKKFDLANIFDMLTGVPTDTDETRRLNNKQLDDLQKEIDALNSRKKILEDALGREYSSLFLAKRDLETEQDKRKKAWLEELVAIMEELEKLEGKRSTEVSARLEIDKQIPSVPRVSLQMVDNKLECKVVGGGIINGNPAGINNMIKYTFEFYLDDVKVHEEIKDFGDKEVKFSPTGEGIWKCRVYANIPSESIFSSQYGEAEFEFLGAQFAADKFVFDKNKKVIATSKNKEELESAVQNLEELRGRAFFIRNTDVIERFINAGRIKVDVVRKFGEAVSISRALPSDVAQKAAKIAEMMRLAKEALELWEPYRDIDGDAYDDISRFISKYSGAAEDVTAKPGEIENGALVKRELKISEGTQKIDDREVVSGVIKGEYLVAVNMLPAAAVQTVVQGNKISFSVALDSQIRNKFNVVVEHDLDGTQKIRDDKIVEISDAPKTVVLEYVAQKHFTAARTLNIKIYDVDYSSRDDNQKIADKTYTITTQSSGVIDTSILGVDDI